MLEKPEKAEKNYSWKGSPNAGRVLAILAAVGAVIILLAGFLN
ncbi:MAG: hypothetical protein Q6L68_15365 [Thermostichus sp. DG02_5_bins_236]